MRLMPLPHHRMIHVAVISFKLFNLDFCTIHLPSMLQNNFPQNAFFSCTKGLLKAKVQGPVDLWMFLEFAALTKLAYISSIQGIHFLEEARSGHDVCSNLKVMLFFYQE